MCSFAPSPKQIIVNDDRDVQLIGSTSKIKRLKFLIFMGDCN